MEKSYLDVMNRRGVSFNPIRNDKQERIIEVLSSERCMRMIHVLSGKEYTVSSLSKRLNIAKSTVSYYLRILEKAGIIEIHHSIDDLRIKKVSLSEQGRSLLFLYENEILFYPIINYK